MISIRSKFRPCSCASNEDVVALIGSCLVVPCRSVYFVRDALIELETDGCAFLSRSRRQGRKYRLRCVIDTERAIIAYLAADESYSLGWQSVSMYQRESLYTNLLFWAFVKFLLNTMSNKQKTNKHRMSVCVYRCECD